MRLPPAADIRAAMLAAGRAPVAKTVPFSQTVQVADTTHVLEDEYQWMRGKAWPKLVEDADIIGHLEAENAYCKDFLASLGDLQETFFQTMKGRMKLTDRSIEDRMGSHYYYSRTEEELQYSIDCRVPVGLFDELRTTGALSEEALKGQEEVILDRNKLAEGKKFCKALGTQVSLNGKVMAYRVDTQGDENYCLNFVDLETGEALPDKLWNVVSYCYHQPADADATGAPPTGIFYALRNKNLRPTKIFYHRLGDACEGSEEFSPNDRLLFSSKNEMFRVGCGTTADRAYVLVRHGSNTENEILAIDVNDPSLSLVNLLPMVDDVQYGVSRSANTWFMRTKAGCAKDHFRLERGEWADAATPGGAVTWSPFICEKADYAFQGLGVTKDLLLLSYLHVTTGVPKLVVRRAAHPEADDGADELFPAQPAAAQYCKLVGFPGIAEPERLSHSAEFSGATDYAQNRVVVVLDTPAQPTTWYDWDWDAASGDGGGGGAAMMPVRKQKEVPNYVSEEYHTERLYARYTEDKTLTLHETLHGSTEPKYAQTDVSVPVTVLYKKSLFKRDGSMPLLLEGYGSYGISEEPVWRNTHTLYADLGFVVATAHIRGGGDLGEPWYQAAKFLSKKRTFSDFIAVADKLVDEKFTSAGNVALVGGSAGGMLVGACLNMRPSLLKAVVAHVPFVTVLDTMLLTVVCPSSLQWYAPPPPAGARHDARRRPAADAGRVQGVGQPARRALLRLHALLLPVRELRLRQGPPAQGSGQHVPVDLRDGRPQCTRLQHRHTHPLPTRHLSPVPTRHPVLAAAQPTTASGTTRRRSGWRASARASPRQRPRLPRERPSASRCSSSRPTWPPGTPGRQAASTG